MNVDKIISGGQSGADRAGLDFAIEKGIPCGGFCPKGRIAEDGPIDARYPLEETSSKDYLVRTKKNVETSDGTVIFTLGPLGRGSKRTLQFCHQLSKPTLWIDGVDNFEANEDELGRKLAQWLSEYNIRVLNIAGSRESKTPGIYNFTRNVLKKV